jgi:hypothetical protein
VERLNRFGAERYSMRRHVRAVAIGIMLVLLGTAVAFMPGCQRVYTYQVRGLVRSAADRSPLAGVRVEMRGGLSGDTLTTGEDGSFEGTFTASDSQFHVGRLPSWSVYLSREGYAFETVDISPRQEPDSGSSPSQLVVVAYMMPLGR